MSADKALKSSFDLAMERLAKRDGAVASLSGAQKKALAEVDARVKAGLAELEIMLHGRLAKAGDDPQSKAAVFERHRVDVEKVRARGEADKERIRRNAAE